MRKCKHIALALLLAAAAVSCGKNTRIDGVLREGAHREVVVKLLDVNRFQVLDTLKTKGDGSFSYALNLEAGQPEFIYLYCGERQIASLLLQKGDKVKVETDTLGVYAVDGSEESALLQEVEKDYGAFMREMNAILAREDQPDPVLSRCYVNYYRSRLSYVLSHPHSLTAVPVLFQQVNPMLPVFNQPTDGILFRNVCDSLAAVYPESRYVKALEKEAQRRLDLLEVNNRLRNAGEVGYLDISLPGIDGKPVQLSASASRLTMLYFWSSTAEQKMFNMDALIPIYEEFHDKGFEIYAVSLDTDKSAWAAAVRNQKLPWVNVCDTRGALSPYVGAYGVSSVPMVWFIADGEIDADAKVTDAASMRSYLRRKL